MKRIFLGMSILVYGVLSLVCFAEENLNLDKYKIYTKDKEKVGVSCIEDTDTTFDNKELSTSVMYEKSRETENYVGNQSVNGNYSFDSDDDKFANINLKSFNRFYKKNMFAGVELEINGDKRNLEDSVSKSSEKEISGEGKIALGNGRIYNYEHWYIANIILEKFQKRNLINREISEDEKVVLAKKINDYKENVKIGTIEIEKYLSDIGVYDNTDVEKSSEIKKIVSTMADRNYDIKNGKIIYLEYSHENSLKDGESEYNSITDNYKINDHSDSVSVYAELSKIISKNRVDDIKIESKRSLNENYYTARVEAGSKLLLNANNSITGDIFYGYIKYKEAENNGVGAVIKLEHYIYNNIKIIPKLALSKEFSAGGNINASTGVEISADIKITDNFKVMSGAEMSKNLNTGNYSDLVSEVSCSYRVEDLEIIPGVKMYKNITTGENADLVLGVLCTYQIK